jgi:hypothetical protein
MTEQLATIGTPINPPDHSAIGSLILAAEIMQHIGEPRASIHIGSTFHEIDLQLFDSNVLKAGHIAERLGLPFARYTFHSGAVQNRWIGRINGVEVTIVQCIDLPQWPERPLALPA